MSGNNSNTRLLLHFDGSGAAVVDSALGGIAKGFTIGGVQSITQKKFDYASLLCNLGGPNCRVSESADWNLAALDWTLDAWVYVTDTAQPFPFGWYVNVDNYLAVERFLTAGGAVTFGFTYRTLGIDTAQGTGSTPITVLDTWHHICLSRSGQTIRLFVDGVSHATGTLPSAWTLLNLTLFPFYVGGGVERASRTLRYLSGYIDEVRLQVNLARTANFTPPADAYQPSLSQGVGGAYQSLYAASQGIGGTFQTGDLSCSQGVGGSFATQLQASQGVGGAFATIGSFSQGVGGAFDVVLTRCSQGIGATFAAVSSYSQGVGGDYAACGFQASQGVGGAFAIKIQASQGVGGTFTTVLRASQGVGGAFKQENLTQVGYELYHGLNAQPDFTAAPAATSATLPFDYAMTGAGLHYLVLRYRNSFGYLSQNITPTIIELDGSNNMIVVVPSAPAAYAATAITGGIIRVTANYLYPLDGAAAANSWLIYMTTNGTDPNPAVDTPTVVAMRKFNGVAKLQWDSAAFGAGLTAKVIVRTRRTTPLRDSTNTTIVTATTATAGPSAPTVAAYHKAQGNLIQVG